MVRKRRGKKLIITLDVGQFNQDWQIKAMQMMISDYFEKCDFLKNDDVVLWPHKGPFEIFWLNGDPDSLEDVKDLKEIKEQIQPVLREALDISSPKIAADTIETMNNAAASLQDQINKMNNDAGENL